MSSDTRIMIWLRRLGALSQLVTGRSPSDWRRSGKCFRYISGHFGLTRPINGASDSH